MSDDTQLQQLAEFLNHTALFRGIDEESRQKIAKAMLVQTYDKDTTLIHQGGKGDTLFLIIQGKVAVLLTDKSLGLEQEVAILGLREVFGEMSILLDEPRSASVRTKEETTCAILSQEAFQQIVVALPQIGLAVSRNLAARLQEQNKLMGFQFIKIFDYKLDAELYALVPPQILERYQMVPLYMDEDTLVVAMTRPNDSTARDALRAATSGVNLRPMACSEYDYENYLKNVIHPALGYAPDGKLSAGKQVEFRPQDVVVLGHQDAKKGIGSELQGTAVVQKFNEIVAAALNRGASDIHLEPMGRELGVRFRVDGRLIPYKTPLPMEFHAPLTSRIKIMSGLDIAEHRRPQDGRVSLRLQDRPFDLRISILPTQHGEKVVLRILDPVGAMKPLDELIMSPPLTDMVRKAVFRPMGGIVVAGPTGSGKTTTLYAAVNERKEVANDLNIVTVEDPIEYSIEGVTQSQAADNPGMGFADILRALLRQDPDIIMVGETRDQVTAQLVLESALTGHLVLTTVHADAAIDAALRFTEMGCPGYLVGSAIDIVIAQRLLRRACPRCRVDHTYTKLVRRNLEAAGILSMEESETLSKGAGCEHCHDTGFQGRVGAYEILQMNDELREAIGEGRGEPFIRKIAHETKALTSFQKFTAFLLQNGFTSPAEVLRHFGGD